MYTFEKFWTKILKNGYCVQWEIGSRKKILTSNNLALVYLVLKWFSVQFKFYCIAWNLIFIGNIPFIDTYPTLWLFFYNRALEIIQDEEYLEESDFNEIKRQKRQINPWTPALVNNVTSLIKDRNSLSKPKLTGYDHSTKRRLRRKRQAEAVTNGN